MCLESEEFRFNGAPSKGIPRLSTLCLIVLQLSTPTSMSVCLSKETTQFSTGRAGRVGRFEWHWRRAGIKGRPDDAPPTQFSNDIIDYLQHYPTRQPRSKMLDNCE